MPLILRPATASDADQLTEIYFSAFANDAISLLVFPRTTPHPYPLDAAFPGMSQTAATNALRPPSSAAPRPASVPVMPLPLIALDCQAHEPVKQLRVRDPGCGK